MKLRKIKLFVTLVVSTLIAFSLSACSNNSAPQIKLTKIQRYALSLTLPQSYYTQLKMQPLSQSFPPGFVSSVKNNLFKCLNISTQMSSANEGIKFNYKVTGKISSNEPFKLNFLSNQAFVFKTVQDAQFFYNAINTASGATCVLEAAEEFALIYGNIQYKINTDVLSSFQYAGGTGIAITTSGIKLSSVYHTAVTLNFYIIQLGNSVSFIWTGSTASPNKVNYIAAANKIYSLYMAQQSKLTTTTNHS